MNSWLRKYPELIPCMKLVKVEETRKQLAIANASRCEANVKIMDEVLRLRLEAAHLLKYPNHAQFRLEVKMAKTQAAVMEFLTGLKKRLRPLAEKEIQELLRLKKAEKEAMALSFDGKIQPWDFQVRVLVVRFSTATYHFSHKC